LYFNIPITKLPIPEEVTTMKSRKLLLTLIGGWILFIVVDGANGRMGALGARSLPRPLQLLWFVTGMLRTIVLFLLAASTYLLVAQQGDDNENSVGDNG
jgi:hypothetical protein